MVETKKKIKIKKDVKKEEPKKKIKIKKEEPKKKIKIKKEEPKKKIVIKKEVKKEAPKKKIKIKKEVKKEEPKKKIKVKKEVKKEKPKKVKKQVADLSFDTNERGLKVLLPDYDKKNINLQELLKIRKKLEKEIESIIFKKQEDPLFFTENFGKKKLKQLDERIEKERQRKYKIKEGIADKFDELVEKNKKLLQNVYFGKQMFFRTPRGVIKTNLPSGELKVRKGLSVYDMIERSKVRNRYDLQFPDFTIEQTKDRFSYYTDMIKKVIEATKLYKDKIDYQKRQTYGGKDNDLVLRNIIPNQRFLVPLKEDVLIKKNKKAVKTTNL